MVFQKPNQGNMFSRKGQKLPWIETFDSSTFTGKPINKLRDIQSYWKLRFGHFACLKTLCTFHNFPPIPTIHFLSQKTRQMTKYSKNMFNKQNNRKNFNSRLKLEKILPVWTHWNLSCTTMRTELRTNED